MIELKHGRLICGAGGAALIGSLFMPWADAGGASASGWELWTMEDILLVIVGLTAIAAALTGGQFGVFRPDASLIGMADILSVIASVLLAWLLLFDFPEGAGRDIGAYVALVSAMAVAAGSGDYATLRGAPLFPRITDAQAPGRELQS